MSETLTLRMQYSLVPGFSDTLKYVVITQLTLNEGRTVEAKKSFYKAVADGLHKRVGLS
jgi:Tautomerase enzyme